MPFAGAWNQTFAKSDTIHTAPHKENAPTNVSVNIYVEHTAYAVDVSMTLTSEAC